MESLLPLTLLVGAFVLSLVVLLASAEKFVGASEEIGLGLGVPAFVMGITVLAIGTSFPELVTALVAVYQGQSEIVAGTVLGSNIANILLILGVTAIIAGNFSIFWDLFHGDLPLLFGSILLLAFIVYPVSTADMALFSSAAANDGGDGGRRAVISFGEGVVLILGYALYVYYYASRRPDSAAAKEEVPERPAIRPMHFVWLVVGLVGVSLGAHFTVIYAIKLATVLSLPEEVVAAGIVAVGTSLPEFVVSMSAARRGNYEMAVGNVTGSNIFNTFMVLGLPAIAAPFLGDHGALKVGTDSILYLQLPYYAATLMLMLITVFDKNLTRTEGLAFLLAYLFFVGKLFGMV
jgi:cation:H+ antiporter